MNVLFTSLRILVVEDNADYRRFICSLLLSEGARVDTANCGLEALEKVRVVEFDIILMDVWMPEMDGLMATKRLRSEGYTKPILGLTARVFKQDRQECLQAGMTKWISKPFEAQELLSAVRTLTQSQ